MIPQVHFPVYVHILFSPPGLRQHHDIDINLINKVGIFELHKENVKGQTRYNVDVLNPSDLGVEDYSPNKVSIVRQDLTLACNLILEKAALTTFYLTVNELTISSQSIPAQVKVMQTPRGTDIQINVSAELRAEISLTVGYKENLDESKVKEVASKLIKLNRFNVDSPSSLYELNLKNALNEYETAMASVDRLFVFKNLYNTLELITNINGEEINGRVLDQKMAQFTGATETECKEWRLLYDRTKHVSRHEKDVETYVSGIKKLSDYIEKMRPLAANGLITRLNGLFRNSGKDRKTYITKPREKTEVCQPKVSDTRETKNMLKKLGQRLSTKQYLF